jgi:dipeptide/tripeptide permease
MWQKLKRLPSSVFFIVSAEFAERFAFYGVGRTFFFLFLLSLTAPVSAFGHSTAVLSVCARDGQGRFYLHLPRL